VAARNKIGLEREFNNSHAAVEPPDLAFAPPLFPSDEGRTAAFKAWDLAQPEKGIKREVRYIFVRDTEQHKGSLIHR
jgi:hypothetical protein